MRLLDGLKWPVVALIATGMLHLGAEAARPDLHDDFGPTMVGAILLVYGLWIGYALVGRGLPASSGVVAGAIVGLLPLALDVVGFGLILGRGLDAGLTAGLFGFLVVVFGSLAGAAFAASRGGPATGRERA
ncbi:MAG TPA: hypothetical protein VFW20_02095 [Candidatus Limnocylindrales bacterium]|nr:hypothetical protein [Candidatus Limnocylindrales bacterium]